MMEISAASIGESLHDIDTPALILDLDAFERNCERLRQALAGFPVNIRPHAKSHKCPEIARRQIAVEPPAPPDGHQAKINAQPSSAVSG